MKFESTKKDFTKAIKRVKEIITSKDNPFICTAITDIIANLQTKKELRTIVLDYRFIAEDLFNASKIREMSAFWSHDNQKDRINYLIWIEENLDKILNNES